MERSISKTSRMIVQATISRLGSVQNAIPLSNAIKRDET
jgi:hypothetical protein